MWFKYLVWYSLSRSEDASTRRHIANSIRTELDERFVVEMRMRREIAEISSPNVYREEEKNSTRKNLFLSRVK